MVRGYSNDIDIKFFCFLARLGMCTGIVTMDSIQLHFWILVKVKKYKQPRESHSLSQMLESSSSRVERNTVLSLSAIKILSRMKDQS